MICTACGLIAPPKKPPPGARCTHCGSEMQRENHDTMRLAAEAYAIARVRDLVWQWTQEGLIERNSADEIQRRLTPPPPQAPQPAAPPALPQQFPQPYEHTQPEPEHAPELDHELPQTAGGLEALAPLAALDAVPIPPPPPSPRVPGKWETEVRPLLYENIGWFLGTLLVLAGSIYGVREAWRTLGGVARHIAVSGALFAYHAGFVGLAALLAKKSKGTGAVLGGIALGLSPIVFVALSSMVEVNVALGAMLSLPFVVGSFFTLRSVGKRFDLESPSLLAFAMLPGLVAELPVGRSDPDSLARVALPFVGVITARIAQRFGSRAVDIAATYGAVALGLYAVVGGPTAAATGPLAGAAVPLFCASLAAVVATGVERSAVRAALPRLTSTITVLALAIVLVSVVVATRHSATDVPRLARFADAATAILAAGTFVVIARGRPASLHVTAIIAPLAGWLVARAVMPDDSQWWPFGTAASASLLIVTGGALDTPRRRVLTGWAVTAAVFALICTPIMEAGTRGHFVATFATGVTLAVAAHGCGGVHRRGLHYLGGFAAMIAALAWILPSAADPGTVIVRFMLAAAGGFAVAGVAFDLRAAVLDEDGDDRARPFEDLSGFALVFAFLGTIPAWRMATTFALDRGATPAVGLRDGTMLALVGFAFVLRAMRDRSAFPSFVGATILGTWAFIAAGPRSPATTAITIAALGFAASAIAMVRGTAEEPGASSRRVFGVVPLPFAATGRRAIADGFAHASWLATAITLLACLAWLKARVEPDRTFAIFAGALLIGTQILGFLSGSYGSYGLRGSVTSLSLIVSLVGFTAVINRIGRPLPPPVVGYKLSAVAVALWGVALGAKRYGPSVGRALGDEESGRRYHVVFHVVVFLLATVLSVDGLMISGAAANVALSVIPPLLVIGPAVALVLEARTLRAPFLVHLAAPLAFAGAAMIATQRSVLGSFPARVFPPEIAWSRGLLGLAACGLAMGVATFAVRDREEAAPTSIWTVVVACTVLAVAWLRVDPIPSALVLASGLGLGLANRRATAEATIGIGAFLVVHAAAQAPGVVPMWAGPAIALLAGLALVASPGSSEKRWPIDSMVAAAIVAAMVYALGEGSRTSALTAGPALVGAATDALLGRWTQLRAVPVTAAIAGVFLTIATFRATGVRASIASLFATLLLAVGLSTGFVVTSPPTAFVIRMLGPGIALAFAVVAAIEQGVASVLDRERNVGARVGRDLMLGLVFATGALFVVTGGPPSPARSGLMFGFVAIAVAAGTAAVAAFRERSGRHVYYVQLAIVAAYALIRTELATAVPPEGDALFGLCLGFLLLGVTVHARRAGIPEVASAVRTFVALLPIGIAFVLPRRASDTAALIAAASGALYGALAWLERNRLFGSLGAAAANVAILLLALAHGFDGAEIYFAAAGLFVLALGHLFGSTMEHGSRIAVRVIGGLLLYAPAAVRLASQLSASPSGVYAVGFGAACLLGVMLGMVLQIRAYLAFGTGFLVLDVIANLTAAGIRDHRIGFLVLSLAGLSILGSMVFVTLQRELVRAWARALRVSLRGWD